MRSPFFALALGLGAAGAQTVSVNISAGVQFPPAVQTAANLVNLLSQGVQVTFLNEAAQPVATLNSGGGIVVKSTVPTAGHLTNVQVMTPIPGTTQAIREVYPLAQPIALAQVTSPRTVQPLSTSTTPARPVAPVTAQSIQVKAADGQTRPLTGVMGRQAAWAREGHPHGGPPGLQKKPGKMPPGQKKKG
ncbi:hypothetical protein [Deinococcus hopiensis]|uniref:Uncharacterized protein n=1 Tax=Deinococcus hopiensis KR-140 TaxID=695939 RepID=A0A1W1V599_9DEIO|nr:hypothetical protein [Deinococcus hopiensis]SMB88465.1 hypothetical protein SAMN00790413_00054 [Deinococcus hopiensis KR-140]